MRLPMVQPEHFDYPPDRRAQRRTDDYDGACHEPEHERPRDEWVFPEAKGQDIKRQRENGPRDERERGATLRPVQDRVHHFTPQSWVLRLAHQISAHSLQCRDSAIPCSPGYGRISQWDTESKLVALDSCLSNAPVNPRARRRRARRFEPLVGPHGSGKSRLPA